MAQHVINSNLNNYVSMGTVGTYGYLMCFENALVCLDHVPVFFFVVVLPVEM